MALNEVDTPFYDELFSANITEKAPYVSVLMITYNHEKYIVQAVSTILEQTYTDFELIISDDTSPDNTQKVLLNYLCDYKGHIPIRYIRLRNNCHRHGTVFQRFARGELLLTMDGDDFSMPHRLQRIVELWDSLEPKPSIMQVNALRYIDATGELEGKAVNINGMEGGRRYFPPQYPLEANFPPFGSAMVRSRAFYEWTRRLDNSHSVIAGDSLIACRALLHNGIWFIDEPLFYYRVNAGSASFGGVANKRWILDRLTRFQILEQDYKMLSPKGEIPSNILKKLHHIQRRMKWGAKLIDCSFLVWLLYWPVYCIISWSSAKNALKARVKLFLFGNVDGSFSKGNVFSFRNVLKGIKGK
jgi:glycosyltransferase involved in cell wall biosynthesis